MEYSSFHVFFEKSRSIAKFIYFGPRCFNNCLEITVDFNNKSLDTKRNSMIIFFLLVCFDFSDQSDVTLGQL